jgi:hypothetical protein
MISGFDQKLIDLIEAHPSIIVGTCDRALVPCMARGFGTRVLQGGPNFELLVSHWPGPQTIANLETNNRIAVTFTAPETFQAYQVKGRASFLGDCDEKDIVLSNAYAAAIRARIIALHEPVSLVTVTFTPRGLFKLLIEADALFLQTPGKNAGARL